MALRIIRLEERIVLDGAGAGTVVEAAEIIDTYAEEVGAPEHDGEDLSAEHHDSADAARHTDGDALGGTDHSDGSELMDYPDGHALTTSAFPDVDADNILTECTSVLVLSDSVENAGQLAAAARDDVLVLRYSPDEMTSEALLASIKNAVGDQQIESIAFVCSAIGDSGMELAGDSALSSSTLAVSKVQQGFWEEIGSLVRDGGNIDLLCQGASAGETDDLLVGQLEATCGCTVVAGDADVDAGIFAWRYAAEETGSCAVSGTTTVSMGGGHSFVVSQATLESNELADVATGIISEAAAIAGSGVGGLNVVLIDTTLQAYEDLAAAVEDGTHVIFFDGDAESANDVLTRAVDYAATRGDTINSLSIMAHGSTGEFKLGNEWIGSDDLANHAEAWHALDVVMNDGGNLYLFGCNVAQDAEVGQILLDGLAAATNTDVFASNDLTGAGGDWELEAASKDGAAELAADLNLAVDIAKLTSYEHNLDTYTGTAGNDTWTGTNKADTAYGLAGDDVLNGGGQDDTLDGGAGNDELYGDTGDDILISGGGNDVMDGGNQNDTFRLTGVQNGDLITIFGGNQTDTIDLSDYNNSQITDNGSTITVDLGGAQSFTINYSGIESITTAEGTYPPGDVPTDNNAPTATNNTVTTDEDMAYTFTAADFNFADVDGHSLSQVQITSVVSAGSLLYNGSDVALNQVIAKADIDAGLLTFAPEADANGAAYDSFQFKVHDGTEYSASAYTMTLDVNEVQDAPTAADNAVITIEDTAYTFTAADFNFADVDGHSLSQVQITSLVSAGSLLYNGSDVALNQVITKADIDAGLLTFAPEADANGAAYDSFQFKVHDGTEYSASAYQMRVDVTAENDAPTLTLSGGNFSVAENAANGTTVATLSASDNDTGQTLTYYIISGNGEGVFGIDPRTGELFVADNSKIDREGTAAYALAIEVSDGIQSDTTNITVQVDDITEGPLAPDSGEEGPRCEEIAGRVPDVQNPVDQEMDEEQQTEEAARAEGSGNKGLPHNATNSSASSANHGGERAQGSGSEGMPRNATHSSASSANHGGEGAGYSDQTTSNDHSMDFAASTRQESASPGLEPNAFGLDMEWLNDPSAYAQETDELETPEELNSRETAIAGGETATSQALLSNNEMWQSLDSVRSEMEATHEAQESDGKWAVPQATGVTSLMGGVVAWIVRGASLVAGLAASLPLWNSFDPLPILDAAGKGQHRQSTKESIDKQRNPNRSEEAADDLFDASKGNEGPGA